MNLQSIFHWKRLARYGAVLLLLACCYPLFALGDGYLETGMVWRNYLLFLPVGMGCFVLWDYLLHHAKHTWLKRPILLLFLAVIAAIAIYNVASRGIATGITAALLRIIQSAAALGFGYASAKREWHNVLHAKSLAACAAANAAALLICDYLDLSVQTWLVLLLFLCLFGLYFLVKNQFNLESLTTNRRYSMADLPKKIRSYNLSLLGMLLGMAAVCILLFQLAAPFLELDRLNPVKQPEQTTQSAVTSEEDIHEYTPQPDIRDQLDAQQNLPPEVTAFLSRFLTFALIAIAVICILVLIYLILHREPPDKRIKTEEDYVDIATSISQKKEKKAAALPDEKKQWRREYRAYCHAEASPERFHTGYLLAIRGLRLAGLPLLLSDTANEIDQKATPELQEDSYHEATLLYNAVTYGAKTGGADTAELDRALVRIAALLRYGWKKSGR